ncbi:MAG: FAD-binding oxidoreductase [Gammaproteobacteria bacterium]|nr:FAD-binding oxidoreductase [Gammaproteobacteria bacterium]
MIYDFIIIGAGVAGCNCAYVLNKAGKKVAIVDKEGVAKGASGAAGAFLSPLPGKKNSYNSLVNKALHYSLDFYEKLIPQATTKKGVLRVADRNFNETKLKDETLGYEYKDAKHLQDVSNNFRNIEGYFYKDAAVVNPSEVCNKLIEGCNFYTQDVEALIFKDGLYNIGNLKAKNIILTQGVNNSLLNIPYINISPVFGLKIDVKSSTKIPFNIHKSISISANKQDGTISIGATRQNHFDEKLTCTTTCDKCQFHINNDEVDVKSLLNQANELIDLHDLEVVEIKKGARATIKSYFPVVGKIIDYETSIKKYPSIKNGTKIAADLLAYYPNLYTVNALGSRGFVFGPYLASILKEHILNEVAIPDDISLEKHFYKTARKNRT